MEVSHSWLTVRPPRSQRSGRGARVSAGTARSDRRTIRAARLGWSLSDVALLDRPPSRPTPVAMNDRPGHDVALGMTTIILNSGDAGSPDVPTAEPERPIDTWDTQIFSIIKGVFFDKPPPHTIILL